MALHQLLDEGIDDRISEFSGLAASRPPIVGHYTDSVVFFDGSCVLALVNLIQSYFHLPTGKFAVQMDRHSPLFSRGSTCLPAQAE